MDYEKMWKELKQGMISDIKALADPECILTSDTAFRIVGEKICLNTILKIEKENSDGTSTQRN